MEFNLEEFCEGGKGRDKEGERERERINKQKKGTKQNKYHRGEAAAVG